VLKAVNILVTLPRVDLLRGCRKEFIESYSTACRENSVSMLPGVSFQAACYWASSTSQRPESNLLLQKEYLTQYYFDKKTYT
jgi:hypothetical protein